MTDSTVDILELLHVVEGERKPRRLEIGHHETVQAVIGRLTTELGRDDLVELLFEEEEVALAADAILSELIADDLRLIHLASRGHIKVFVGYNGRQIFHDFRPNVTIATVTKWAISPKELDLQGEPSDFQLKLGNDVLPPDTHIGQLARCGHELHLALVFKIKPQG
jgi:hypothetical protein